MVNEMMQRAEEKMNKALENLSGSLNTLRAGRANAHILDKVTVDYYGAPTAINQLATVAAPEARLITVQPYDTTALPAIEKAILTADLGFNPSNVRRKSDQKLKTAQKDGDISEDEMHDGQKSVQKLTDKKIKEIDAVLNAKEEEILAV